MFNKTTFVLLASLLGACAQIEYPEDVGTTKPQVTCTELSYTYGWGTPSYFTYECDAYPGGDCIAVEGQVGQYQCSGRVDGVRYVCADSVPR